MSAERLASSARNPKNVTITSHATLPPGTGRREVIALICETGRRLGLSTTATAVLTRIIGSTAHDAWTDPSKEPIFYGRQETLAARIGLCARQLRNHETTFARLGLIERRTLANGGRAGGSGIGLRLAPLIERFAELVALRDEARAQADRMKTLAALRSVRKREIADLLAGLDTDHRGHTVVTAIERQWLAWPRADALIPMGEDRLRKHVEDATTLCIRLADWVADRREPSGQPEETFRSITEEKQETSDPRKRLEPDGGVTTDTPGQPIATPSREDGKIESDKKEATRTAFRRPSVPPLGLPDLVEMGTTAFRFEVEARMGTLSRGLDHAFVDAAAARIAPLRIAPGAWEEACAVMGRARAATCVMIVDANRRHPTHPIRNPGGTLRGLTCAFERGRLDLPGSLAALWRRRRAERGSA